MLATALFTTLLAVQELPERPPLPTDSAEAITMVRALARAHYLRDERDPGFLTVWAWVEAWGDRGTAERPFPRTAIPCRGESFEDCFTGDWSCRDARFCGFSRQREYRARLIEDLEDLATVAGEAELVYRQRVAFADKHGDHERADSIAHSCAGTEWWCLALRGFTAHRLSPGAGLAAFDSAMSAAPELVRCGWLDPSAVAGQPQGESLGCDPSDPEVARFWWLADPLWSRAGNERRAEHFTRHVMQRMELDLYPSWLEGCTFIPKGYPNSWDRAVVQSQSLLRRYRDEGSRMCLDRPSGSSSPPSSRERPRSMRFRYVYGGYSFAPDIARWADPLGSSADDWSLHWDRGDERLVPRERYHDLDHQTVVLRRGERYRMVAAATLPPELVRLDPPEAALVLGRVEDLELFLAPATLEDARVFRASVEVEEGGYLASLEVIGPEDVARARHGAPAPSLENGFGVSDLALVDGRFEVDALSLEEALLPSLTLPREGQVGLYFEMYGVTEDEVLEVELTARAIQTSIVGRVLSALRLRSGSSPLRVTWTEPADPGEEALVRRFFLLEAGSLPAGVSELTLTVHREDGLRASVSREVRRR
jgi:hypothetical protein